jgi:hypothetical protein
MQSVEIANYKKYLDRSKSMGSRTQILLAFSVAFFIGALNAVYGYAFWVAGIWIERGYYNPVLGRNYGGADIIVVFWGVMFGIFALTSIPQHA